MKNTCFIGRKSAYISIYLICFGLAPQRLIKISKG